MKSKAYFDYSATYGYSINLYSFKIDEINYSELKAFNFQHTRIKGETEEDADVLKSLTIKLRDSVNLQTFKLSYEYYWINTQPELAKAMYALDFRCFFNTKSLKAIELQIEKLSLLQKRILYLCVSKIKTLKKFSLWLNNDDKSISANLFRSELNNMNLAMSLISVKCVNILQISDIFYLANQKVRVRSISVILNTVPENEFGRLKYILAQFLRYHKEYPRKMISRLDYEYPQMCNYLNSFVFI